MRNTKSFSIDFSALNFRSTNNYVYVYRLLDYDDSWIELPKNEHTVTYMNLPPSHYRLRLNMYQKDILIWGR